MVMALVLPEQHCSLVDAYEKCRALADAKACCDYALHIGVTWWGPKVRSRWVNMYRERIVWEKLETIFFRLLFLQNYQ